jgi:hypothetical protein
MHAIVAARTEGNQIPLIIVALLAPQLPVVDLQVLRRATKLASPTIPIQHLLTKLPVGLRIEFSARSFRPNSHHDAFCRICPRNSCCCSQGRNLKNLVIECSNISGFPLSRFAPARKSAQIISRQ